MPPSLSSPQWLNEDTLVWRVNAELPAQQISIARAFVRHALLEPGVKDAYCAFDQICVQVRLDITPAQIDRLSNWGPPAATETTSKIVRVPVCYDTRLALDLDAIAQHHGITAADVIRRHCAMQPTVNAIGFAPGFGYLGPVDPIFDLPRRSSPRKQVPAGSVAIAAGQTVIYPKASPAGWHIIGRSPVQLMQYNDDPTPLWELGDQIEFYPISYQEWLACSS